MFQYLFLRPNNRSELCVHDARVQFTVHQRSSLIVLYVAGVHRSGELDIFTETLLLEITWSWTVKLVDGIRTLSRRKEGLN